jgi:hypothetical protein
MSAGLLASRIHRFNTLCLPGLPFLRCRSIAGGFGGTVEYLSMQKDGQFAGLTHGTVAGWVATVHSNLSERPDLVVAAGPTVACLQPQKTVQPPPPLAPVQTACTFCSARVLAVGQVCCAG